MFYYSPKWNFYFTCKQLAKLLPDEEAIIVAHDWLELGMVSQLGLQNRVVAFLHGDYYYYYQLAKLHQSSVDSFIAIANSIEIKLKTILPTKEMNIHYLRFPVPSFKYPKKQNGINNIIFIGRLTKDKGYHLLPIIDNLLQKKNIHLSWHIVGEGDDSNTFEVVWDKSSCVYLYGGISNNAVLTLLTNMNYFILPSSAEGMPVSLIEAMKSGAVPFVNDIEGGIQELVKVGVTGFKIKNNETAVYADCIEELIQNNNLFAEMSSNCIAISNKLFNPDENIQLIEAEICTTYSASLKIKKSKRIYGSRLDQKWIPNLITKTVRNFK